MNLGSQPIVIENASTGDGSPAAFAVNNGQFQSDIAAGSRSIAGDGLTAVPGFLDLQVNGAVGIDLAVNPAGLWDVAAALPQFGVTAFLPTLVTCSPQTIEKAREVIAAGPPLGWVGAVPLGWHFEGPMINAAYAGAHARRHIRTPSLEFVRSWSTPTVAMVTIAPELPGMGPVIRTLRGRGVVVAAGHTGATADDARAAAAAGVGMVTHLFNAMAPVHHRAAGLAGAVLGGLPLPASLIADGLHVDPDAIRLAWRALGPDRRVLVSDATAALGAPAGRYSLGDTHIVSDGEVVRTDSGGLAGTARGLDEMVRTVRRIVGCTLSDAVASVTQAPAAVLGRPAPTLGVGASSDLVLLDSDGRVALTLVHGNVAFDRNGT